MYIRGMNMIEEYPVLRGIDIVFRPERCLSCRACELACAVSKSKSQNLFEAIYEETPPQKRLQVRQSSSSEVLIQERCSHCKDAACIKSCKFNAISRDPETLTVVIDEDICKGCMLCVKACEKKVLKIVKEKGKKPVALKCTYCAELSTGPECVRSCPTDALVITLASKHLITNIEK